MDKTQRIKQNGKDFYFTPGKNGSLYTKSDVKPGLNIPTERNAKVVPGSKDPITSPQVIEDTGHGYSGKKI